MSFILKKSKVRFKDNNGNYVKDINSIEDYTELDSKIDELKSDIDNIEFCSASKIIAKAKDTDESGFNYYYDGSHQDSTYFRTTDFIDVSLYKTITVTDKTTTS